MRKVIKFKLILGIVLVLVSILPFYKWDYSNWFFVLSMWLILIVTNIIYLHRKDDLYKKDERTQKIAAFAAMRSWTYSVLALAILFFLTKMELINIASIDLLSMFIMFMCATFYISYFYIAKKWDIN